MSEVSRGDLDVKLLDLRCMAERNPSLPPGNRSGDLAHCLDVTRYSWRITPAGNLPFSCKSLAREQFTAYGCSYSTSGFMQLDNTRGNG